MIWDEKRPGYCRHIINNRETFVKDGHVWGDETIKAHVGPRTETPNWTPADKTEDRNGGMIKQELSQGQFCQLCGAWCGCLGLEPTPELYIQHLVEIFREIRRVLRSDGTLWLNMGSSMWSGAKDDMMELRNDLTLKEKSYVLTELVKSLAISEETQDGRE